MANVRFLTKKQTGQGICLFVLLCGIYGLYPSLKKLPASNWIQLITGLSSSAAALLVAGVGYKNYQELQRKNARDTETAAQNYQALVDKNTADRFRGAVEMLGHEKLDVQLGGIFALEQIANTEDKYYWPIMEILPAYIRSKTLAMERIGQLSPAFQIIMTVISRRKYSYLQGEEYRLNLRNAYLEGVIFPPGAKLQGIDFTGSNLKQAILRRVELKQAILDMTNLDLAELQESNLYETSFKDAHLWKTQFTVNVSSNLPIKSAVQFMNNAHHLTLEQIGVAREQSYQHAVLPSYIDIQSDESQQILEQARNTVKIPF
jgi:Pentapeptide repeats (8 copies)